MPGGKPRLELMEIQLDEGSGPAQPEYGVTFTGVGPPPGPLTFQPGWPVAAVRFKSGTGRQATFSKMVPCRAKNPPPLSPSGMPLTVQTDFIQDLRSAL